MAVGNWAKCKYCGQQIIWIRTSSGKMMPCNPGLIDYVEVKGGREKIVRMDGAVVAAEIVDGKHFEPDGTGYTSHFATCPKAGKARRR